ncbi:MAG TPA: CHRD domain-containing protein [Flavisolibacter sp.]|nr:CHRD domain-containing protein [Flavisolibacter sp.]
MKRKNLFFRFTPFLILSAICIASGNSIWAQQNGAVPGTLESILNNQNAREATTLATGLQQIYSATGKYTLSADGVGSVNSSMSISVNKPNAQATVHKAILMSSATFTTIANGCITLSGTPITWNGSATSNTSILFTNYWADVTSVIASQVNALPAGISNLTITECNTNSIEGEALLVIFNDPMASEKTVVIMFGAQSPTGDNFSLTLAQAIDPNQAGALLDMGLGIGFGFQQFGGSQASQVSVNGQRITSSAGGEDDGSSSNGALLTVGGIGDANNNPSNPNVGPANPRSDDELYSILPFITNTATSLNINTINPSNDDNIFLAYFAISGAAIVGEGILLSQTATAGNIGTQHTVKASVLNSNGQPLANRLVTFTITSGPNTGNTFSTNTNSNGEAFYTYPGSGGIGTDNIQACFTNSQSQINCSNIISFEWTSTIVGPIYYSKPAGDLHNVQTWGLNPDGTGANPLDFNDSIFQLANRPSGLYTMTGDWAVNGGLIRIPTSSQLQINGNTLALTNVEGAGTISGSSSSNLSVIGMSGGSVLLNFTPSDNTLNNLTVNRAGSGAMAVLGNALNVLNVVTVTEGALNSNGNLVLKSTAANTARVAPVSGSISGAVTVERYIPARRAWRILAAPVGGLSDAASGQANMTHSQETVRGALVTSGGTPRPLSFGTATFSLNQARTELTFTATIFNIDVTGTQTPADINDNLVAAHIHVGAPVGANAPVRWGFFGTPDNDNSPKQLAVTPFVSGVGGTFTSTWDLVEGNAGTTLTTNLPGILAGLSYINFHTVQFAGGEIRGQINMVGAGTQTINQAWQEGAILGLSPNPNPSPGYGTHITGGPIYGSTANGFDQNPGAESSIKRYNSIINNWEVLQNTNATYVGADAYMTFIRGDRGIPIGLNTVPPTTTTLRAKGPLRVGDQVFQVSATGFTAIPNPYASPINLATITRNGVQNNFYVWDPKLGGANGVGAYVLLSDNGMGGYNITPAPASPMSQYIQSGQGFLVSPSVTGTPGSVVIKESDKSATPAMDVFRAAGGRNDASANTLKIVDPSSGQGLRVTLREVNADATASVLDEVFSSFEATYSEKLDNLDAVKMENVQENLGMVRDGNVLMIERKPLPQEGDVIALKLWNTTPKSYLLEINPVNLSTTGLTAYVEDKFTGTITPVALTEKGIITFSVTSNPASSRLDRFKITFARKAPDAITLSAEKSQISAYPTLLEGTTINLSFVGQEKGAYQVRLFNDLGQVVFQKTIQHGGGNAVQVLTLNKKPVAGIYQLQVAGKQTVVSLPISCR